MLLLLCLALVVHLTGATIEDISNCRVAYFGKLSTSVKRAFSLLITPNGTIGSLGNQTTLKTVPSYQATEFEIFVGDKLLQTVSYNGSETITDLTACRHQGVVLQSGQQMCDGKTGLISCSAAGELVKEQCGVGEICNPKPTSNTSVYVCTSAPQCALVGPVMVDFAGHVGLVPDLCSYTLLEAENFVVVAKFKDRRRTDMGFLHCVILNATESNSHTNTTSS